MATSSSYMDALKSLNLEHFLDKDVDLTKFFSKEELEKMSHHEQQRFKNIAQNYEIMTYMGLPAIKPEFMKGPSYRAKQAKSLQNLKFPKEVQQVEENISDDSDEEWTPDMERKKRMKEPKPKIPHFLKPMKRPALRCENEKPAKRQKRSVAAAAPVEQDCAEEPVLERRYDLRERQPANFMNLEPPDDDHFLYCEDCNKEYDMDCPIHGPLLYIQDTQVTDDNDSDRALHTLPEGLVVRTSSIPGAGLGVFTQTEIQPRVLYGPYGGVNITDSQKAHDSGYCWQIYTAGKPTHFVDAQDKTNSNWMRYVNCANTENEQNLVAFQYKGGIYYRTFKVIDQGTELLTWYGDEYAREFGVVRDKNLLIRPKYVNDKEYYPCVFCKVNFSTAPYCVRHLIRQHGRNKLTTSDIQTLDEWLRTHDPENYGFKRRILKPIYTTISRDATNLTITCKTKSFVSDVQKCPQINTCKYTSTLQSQIKTHTREKPFKCDVCEYACSHKQHNLQNDMRTHTGEKPFKCDVCKYACSRTSHLQNHMRTHTGEKHFKCDVCEYACNDPSNLQRHKRTHTGEKPFKCDVCEYACSQPSHLQIHMRTHTGEKPFKCDVCEYACSQGSTLQIHMRTHTGEKPFKCDVCEYACSQNSQLQIHMRTHTGEKPFKCDVCEYACSHRSHLQIHMRTHTGEKPFKCDVCEYACSRTSHLQNHMRTHTGEKPFKCDVCEYACSHRSALQNHMRTHTGEKPFKCDVCEYACSQRSALQRHMRTHTGEKLFKCDVCEYACSHRSALQNHMRTHTGEKPFKCGVCEYACSQNSDLQKHMRTPTGEKPSKM